MSGPGIPAPWRARIPLRAGLLLLAAVLMLAAAFMPTITGRTETYAMVIALDITQSMNVRDYRIDDKPVSRLDFAKDAVRVALRRLPCGSQVGLAVFSDYRVLLLLTPVEVCANFTDLVSVLEHIDGRMAWSSGSQIAKGVHWGLQLVRRLSAKPGLVFVTDGHEAPPVDPVSALQFDDDSAHTPGIIIGTGGMKLRPIPLLDSDGKQIGFWRADQVVQSVPQATTEPRPRRYVGSNEAGRAAQPVVVTGTEHLSSLKETYLKRLAKSVGIAYRRLDGSGDLVEALESAPFAREHTGRVGLGRPLAMLGLCALVLAFFDICRVQRALRRLAGSPRVYSIVPR